MQIVTGLRQASAGQFEGRVATQVVQIVGIGIATGDCKDAGAQNIRHGMSDQRRVAMVCHERGQRVDQTEPAVGTGQQQNAAVRTDLSAIERGGDFFLADTWQREREQGIVGAVGMADSVRAARVASVTNLYAIPDS